MQINILERIKKKLKIKSLKKNFKQNITIHLCSH